MEAVAALIAAAAAPRSRSCDAWDAGGRAGPSGARGDDDGGRASDASGDERENEDEDEVEGEDEGAAAHAGRSHDATKNFPAAEDGARAPPWPAPPGARSLRFAIGASGWLFAYHLGVVKRLRELGLHRGADCVGTSGGALAGSFLFLDDVDTADVAAFLAECATDSRAGGLAGMFRIREYVDEAITRYASGDAHARLSGRMTASVTALRAAWPPLRNTRVSSFPSARSLRETMLASANAAPLAGPPRFNALLGCFATDGMFSELQLMRGWARSGTFCKLHEDACERTVTVSAWYWSRADIRPSTYIPVWWAFFAPRAGAVLDIFDLGYADAQAWAERAAAAARAAIAGEAAGGGASRPSRVSAAAAEALARGPAPDAARAGAAARVARSTGGWTLAAERAPAVAGASARASTGAAGGVAGRARACVVRSGRGAYVWAGFAVVFACRLVALWLVYVELNLQGAASAWIAALSATRRRMARRKPRKPSAAASAEAGGSAEAAHEAAAEAEAEAVDASPGARARPGPGGDLRRAGSGHMLLRSAEYYLQTLSPKLALLWLRQGLTGAEVDDLATLSLFFRLFSFLF